MAFTTLPPLIGEAITEHGYTTPTDVQSAVLQPEAEGRDLLVSAQTGSGKTVAFGLAMARTLLGDAERFPVPGEPLALVIAPTRELALQVHRELVWLYGKAGGRVATCVGGMDIRREQRTLSHGVHVVVGTPGRLRDHLERGSLATGSVRAVVLDEADEMLDLGFREELEEILDTTPAERRTLLFSATMPKPIVNLARTYQRDALRISTVSAERGHGDIAYQAVAVAPADIENAVVNLLRFHEASAALVFCATRENVRRLHASLTERGFDAVALSGELSQNERNHALQALRDRRARVCIATDVAARGIDLPDLSLVIHAELPRDAETLQHRSGRTGRAGRKGTAVLLVPFQRRRMVESMLRGARIPVEWTPPPSVDDIRARDRDRLIETLTQPIEPDEDDGEIVARLVADLTPEDLAGRLVRAHRGKLPAPEELIANGPAPASDRPREGFADSVWFRLNIGRRHNADPRWLLPLLCRRGHITKGDVGAIRIGPNETMVQISQAAAAKFVASVAKTSVEADDGLVVTPGGDGPPPSGPRGPARRSDPPRHQGRPRA